MKVVIASTSDGKQGGFAAAYRLNQGLRSLDVDSKMLVGTKTRTDSSIVEPQSQHAKLWSRIAPTLEKFPTRFCRCEDDKLSAAWVPDNIVSRVNTLSPDIVNLHWVNNGFMRLETLKKFKIPIVWTLHDMWAFTGGEHYTMDSSRYREGYTVNNRQSGEQGWDFKRWVWNRKKRAWGNVRNLTLVTPSRWLADCARDSALFNKTRVDVIANGINHTLFKPRDRTAVREILGLPQDKHLVLFGAVNATSDRRKGFHLLEEALKYVSSGQNATDVELVVFGGSTEKKEINEHGLVCHYLGQFNDELSLSLVYSSADVFVAPSLQDNLPNTVLESMACGTPVIAFNIGGMPDMIEHQKNGFLAHAYEARELAEGIQWVVSDADRWRWLSESARSKVETSFTLKVQASNYLHLFEELM